MGATTRHGRSRLRDQRVPQAGALKYSRQSKYQPSMPSVHTPTIVSTIAGNSVGAGSEDISWVLLDVSVTPDFEHQPLVPNDHIAKQFRELADAWYVQKGPSSSATQKAMLPSYQKIIGLGRPVVPFILRELQHHPDHWFWALEALLAPGEENPVQEADKGNIRKMTDAWLRWGMDKGLIS